MRAKKIRNRLSTVNWERVGRLMIAATEAASRLIEALTHVR